MMAILILINKAIEDGSKLSNGNKENDDNATKQSLLCKSDRESIVVILKITVVLFCLPITDSKLTMIIFYLKYESELFY